MHVSAVQFQPGVGDSDANLATIQRLAEAAVSAGSTPVAFPAMRLVGYWHLRRRTEQVLRELSQPIDGPLIGAVGRLARLGGWCLAEQKRLRRRLQQQAGLVG